MVAVNKPAGVAVHGGSGVSFGVIEQLRAARPDAPFLERAHRLDRETSGLMHISKKRAALIGRHDMMREGGGRKHNKPLVGRSEERRVGKEWVSKGGTGGGTKTK